ncbi:metalloprotease [Chryseobacterium cucumeris]|uniref:metalloprotease n=1 Tax=Chryseobacterium cucumeris TaxID=1813611 RepID=UPI0023F0E11A|nr:metalloprotease [Chryseobacterium cucumeris]
MKKKQLFLLAGISILSLLACNDGDSEDLVLSKNEKIEQSETSKILCSFPYYPAFSCSSVIKDNLIDDEDTSIMYNALTKMANYWKIQEPSLMFVHDPVNPYSTKTAVVHPDGFILYGYAQFYDAVQNDHNNYNHTILPITILMHEFAHILQFTHNLPNPGNLPPNSYITEGIKELEADGFTGFYLGRPKGLNKTKFSEIASVCDYFAMNATNKHHGTPEQRRSAVRLGFLLATEWGVDLTPQDFDKYFFLYFAGVYNGEYRNKTSENFRNPKLDAFIRKHIDELRKIASGEISAEEFKKL